MAVMNYSLQSLSLELYKERWPGHDLEVSSTGLSLLLVLLCIDCIQISYRSWPLGCPSDILETSLTHYRDIFFGLRLITHTGHLEDVTRTSLGYPWNIIIQFALYYK